MQCSAYIYHSSWRINWYLLSASLLVIIKRINSVPLELTFIVNTQNASRVVPICVGEGEVLNSAIAWIYPLVENVQDLPSIDSSYFPISNNPYNCNFGQTKPCNKKWVTDTWKSSKFDVGTLNPILDARWENFPTYVTSNVTAEFSVRVDVPSMFEIGISIRAAKNAEIFVCEGWQPKRYGCYYLNIGGLDNKQSVLHKYKNGILEDMLKDDVALANYKHEVGILSEEEWKTFSLSLNVNGTIKLRECVTNLTILSYTDKKPLRPIQIIARSKDQKALWKFHKNDFIFTTKPKISKFGPELHLYGSQLCVALHVSLCNYCAMRLFMFQNGERETLKEIVSENVNSSSHHQELTWKEIKLIRNNVFNDTVQLYVESYYAKKYEYGFWAIDDVRVCAVDEIRVTKLLLNKLTLKDLQTSHIVCEVLKNPMWRPIDPVAWNPLTNVVCNSSTSTSIQLFWDSSSDDSTYQGYSIVQYEGHDICSNEEEGSINVERIKSRGYLIGKNNHIDITDLVPYTHYSINFWNILDDSHKQHFERNTLPTEIPTKDEIPKFIKMTISDTVNIIEWQKPKCTVQYGKIMYQLYVKDQSGNDTRYYFDISTRYKLNNLLPFTNYTIEIQTARNIANFNNTGSYIKIIQNFTTKAGVAPKVINLELYATNERSASIRFDLPQNCNGFPTVVQIRWCHPLFLSKCLSEQHKLVKCKLWDSKYCIEIKNLMDNGEYVFNVSIKNQDTFRFSEEETVTGKAVEGVPGKPSGLMYHAIESKKNGTPCNLNISWEHPYKQNGTITMFDVFLEETSYNLAADTSKTIHEILKIDPNNYQKRYNCIVNYVSYDTPYKISVRAENDEYKGDFEVIYIKTESEEVYIDQTPEFVNCTNETITFMLPQVNRGLNSTVLIVIVQGYDARETHIPDDIVKLKVFYGNYKLCKNFGETWVAKSLPIHGGEEPVIVIGDRTSSFIPLLQKNIVNKPLKPDTEYCFTFVLVNQQGNTNRIDVYHYNHLYTQRNSMAQAQDDDKSVNVAIYVVPILFAILLIVCGVWFLRRYFIKKQTGEHIYESMPFDDYLPDAVTNQSYDTLVHN